MSCKYWKKNGKNKDQFPSRITAKLDRPKTWEVSKSFYNYENISIANNRLTRVKDKERINLSKFKRFWNILNESEYIFFPYPDKNKNVGVFNNANNSFEFVPWDLSPGIGYVRETCAPFEIVDTDTDDWVKGLSNGDKMEKR